MRPLLSCALALLCLAALARAQTPPKPQTPQTPGKVIARSEIEGPMMKLIQEFSQGQIKVQDLIRKYQLLSMATGDRRAEAIHHFLYGRVLASPVVKRYDDAQDEFEHALKLWPDFPAAHISLAALAERLHDYRRARSHLRSALRIDPNYASAYLELGNLEAVHENNLKGALVYFKTAFGKDATPEAAGALMTVYVQLYKSCYDDKKKADYAAKAINAAKALSFLASKDGMGQVYLADTYEDLGRLDDAIHTFEQTARSSVPETVQLMCLNRLVTIYLDKRRDSKKAVEALQRMLAYKSVQGSERDKLQQLCDVCRTKGPLYVDCLLAKQKIATLQNDGKSVRERCDALRTALSILGRHYGTDEPKMDETKKHIVQAVLHSFVHAPAEMLCIILNFFRDVKGPDPRLLPLFVYYVYPYDNDRITPRVRVEATRTLVVCDGKAVLPILLSCLSDANGTVLREVDKSLTLLTEIRSPVSDGIDALTPGEIQKCREFWRARLHSGDLDDALKQSFEKLSKIVALKDKQNQANRAGGVQQVPIADDVSVLVTDAEVPWGTWQRAYEFLCQYLGKDFRPVGLRSTPLSPDQRAGIVKAIDAFWGGAAAPAAPPDPPTKPASAAKPASSSKKKGK